MATEISSILSILDCAVGPVVVKEDVLTDFDIDDFVHFVNMDQGEKMNLYQKASRADEELAKDRTPVEVGDISVGGF